MTFSVIIITVQARPSDRSISRDQGGVEWVDPRHRHRAIMVRIDCQGNCAVRGTRKTKITEMQSSSNFAMNNDHHGDAV